MDKRTVIFESLPKENIFLRAYRSIFKRPRENEHIHLSLNGRLLIIKRGVIVEIPMSYLCVADSVPKEWTDKWKYNYKIV